MPLGRFVVWDTIGDHFSIDEANCFGQHVLLSHVSNDLMRCLLMIQPMGKARPQSPDTGLIFLSEDLVCLYEGGRASALSTDPQSN